MFGTDQAKHVAFSKMPLPTTYTPASSKAAKATSSFKHLLILQHRNL